MTDKKLRKFCMDFRNGLLGEKSSRDMCFVTCGPLQGLLAMCGVESELVEGVLELDEADFHHYWIRLSDDRIIDPTADQFKDPDGNQMPPVYVGQKPDWYKENECASTPSPCSP